MTTEWGVLLLYLILFLLLGKTLIEHIEESPTIPRKKIVGPCSLHLFYGHGKAVYIFGEHHVPDIVPNTCGGEKDKMEIKEFIKYMVNAPDSYLLVELPPSSQIHLNSTGGYYNVNPRDGSLLTVNNVLNEVWDDHIIKVDNRYSTELGRLIMKGVNDYVTTGKTDSLECQYLDGLCKNTRGLESFFPNLIDTTEFKKQDRKFKQCRTLADKIDILDNMLIWIMDQAIVDFIRRSESRVIVIYVGAGHANNIAKEVSGLGLKSHRWKCNNRDIRCLDLR